MPSKVVHPLLRPLAFRPLPLGAILPTGWLHRQLRLQADGLSGHVDEFWPDIQNSAWIGGTADGWERGPYWLDGFIPLAFLVKDERLIAKAKRWIDYIIDHRQADGWLAPVQADRTRMYDPWPTFVLFKAFIQYFEATADARVISAMQDCIARMNTLLDEQPLHKWGHVRWPELVWCLHWLYDHTHDASILDFGKKARKQGYDWSALFAAFPYKERVVQKPDMQTHGVNNAMALKAPGLCFRETGSASEREVVSKILEDLDTYHGTAVGVFTCDEHFAGREPSQGTELCAVVEEMFSLEVLASILGSPALLDRLELIAFNALPATFKSDMCAHQYDQQSNQVVVKVSDERVFATNGPHSTIFGLEPHFGCCLANMHQGWPKFAESLWMTTAEGGLALLAYAPCTVSAEIDGHKVDVKVDTLYPFDEIVQCTLTTADAVRFPLDLRVPGWADGATLQVGEDPPISLKAGSFHRIDRTWQGNVVVRLRFPMSPRIHRGHRDSAIIQRGPLVYSLAIATSWKLLNRQPPFADWEVFPESPWNYALQLNTAEPSKSIEFESSDVGPDPFSPTSAPVKARVKGRLLSTWTLEKNAAGPMPQSPVRSVAAEEELTLIPYGSAKLRVTEFPLLVETEEFGH